MVKIERRRANPIMGERYLPKEQLQRYQKKGSFVFKIS
jgi:hypothetical protein